MQTGDGLISVRSKHDVVETTRRLRDAVEKAGLTVFLEIDHAQNASMAGLTLGPTRLLIFGNPRGGTPLMQSNRTAAIDLPFKALIWHDDNGATWLTYNDPQWLAKRHNIYPGTNPAISAIDSGMKGLSLAATT
jgi:uncharacterized protein (DUF302 family)